MKKKLLVNFVYWQNVGHVIEALRYTLGYYRANPDWEISLVLNKNAPSALAQICPWIKEIYLVDIPDEDAEINLSTYNEIPKNWDYVASTDRSVKKEYCPGAFWEYYRQMDKYLKVRFVSAICGDKKIPYAPRQKLLLDLPKGNLDYAKKNLLKTKVKIGIMFGGHKNSKYFPSFKSWRMIIDSLYKQYDDLSVYFSGKLCPFTLEVIIH